MTKTEKLQLAAEELITNSSNVFEAYEKFNDFMKKQQYFKNKKTASRKCEFVPMLIIVELKKYIAQGRYEPWLFEHEYIGRFDRDIWNLYYSLLYKYKYMPQGYWIVKKWLNNYAQKQLKKTYREFYPEYAQANELLKSIIMLKAVDIDTEKLEKQFYDITKNDAKVIANLPIVRRIVNEQT